MIYEYEDRQYIYAIQGSIVAPTQLDLTHKIVVKDMEILECCIGQRNIQDFPYLNKEFRNMKMFPLLLYTCNSILD